MAITATGGRVVIERATATMADVRAVTAVGVAVGIGTTIDREAPESSERTSGTLKPATLSAGFWRGQLAAIQIL
jgi:hypothetical protein